MELGTETGSVFLTQDECMVRFLDARAMVHFRRQSECMVRFLNARAMIHFRRQSECMVRFLISW